MRCYTLAMPYIRSLSPPFYVAFLLFIIEVSRGGGAIYCALKHFWILLSGHQQNRVKEQESKVIIEYDTRGFFSQGSISTSVGKYDGRRNTQDPVCMNSGTLLASRTTIYFKYQCIGLMCQLHFHMMWFIIIMSVISLPPCLLAS